MDSPTAVFWGLMFIQLGAPSRRNTNLKGCPRRGPELNINRTVPCSCTRAETIRGAYSSLNRAGRHVLDCLLHNAGKNTSMLYFNTRLHLCVHLSSVKWRVGGCKQGVQPLSTIVIGLGRSVFCQLCTLSRHLIASPISLPATKLMTATHLFLTPSV